MTTKNVWTLPVIDINGELGFELPEDLAEYMELEPDDTILWEQLDSFSWALTKEKDDE